MEPWSRTCSSNGFSKIFPHVGIVTCTHASRQERYRESCDTDDMKEMGANIIHCEKHFKTKCERNAGQQRKRNARDRERQKERKSKETAVVFVCHSGGNMRERNKKQIERRGTRKEQSCVLAWIVLLYISIVCSVL